MNREQAYFKQIDLSNQKSISSKKLKDMITSKIKYNIAIIETSSTEYYIDFNYNGAYELLLFGRFNLDLYDDTEYEYIYNKIWQAREKRMEELRNDQV